MGTAHQNDLAHGIGLLSEWLVSTGDQTTFSSGCAKQCMHYEDLYQGTVCFRVCEAVQAMYAQSMWVSIRDTARSWLGSWMCLQSFVLAICSGGVSVQVIRHMEQIGQT
jgi:hypothetical protein